MPSPAGKGDHLWWMRRTDFKQTIVFLNQILFVNIEKLLENQGFCFILNSFIYTKWCSPHPPPRRSPFSAGEG